MSFTSRAISSGPPGAVADFEQLYEDHCRRLLGLAWCLTSSAADAEDAVQETFLRALRAAPLYEERQQAAAWLSRILVNVVRDMRRHSACARRLEPDVAHCYGDPVDHGADPERAGAASEELAAAVAALETLPESFRLVLVMRRIEGLPTAEVARVLRVPPATVRTRLNRASNRLAASLEAQRRPQQRCSP